MPETDQGGGAAQWPEVIDREVQYPARVRMQATSEDGVVDLVPVPGEVTSEGTDVGAALFEAMRNYVDSRDGAKADSAYLRQELGRVDGAIAGLEGRTDKLGAGKVSKAGDIMTGNLNIGDPDGRGDNASASVMVWRNDKSADRDGKAPARLALALDQTGGGVVNTGHFDDSGAFVAENSLSLLKGSTKLGKPLEVASGGTGANTAAKACENLIRGQSIWPRYIELGMGAANQNNGGFIDFHYNQSSADNTSRIIESASGTLDINGSPFKRGAGLPIANGGTGAITVAAAQNNLQVPSAQRTAKSFSLDSGHLTGSVNYYMRGGVAVIDLVANRVAGGSISNGSRSTGIVLPTNMRPPYTIRSSALAPTNNYPDPLPSVFFAVDSAGTVHVSYTASIAPASGYTWTFMGQLVICNGVG